MSKAGPFLAPQGRIFLSLGFQPQAGRGGSVSQSWRGGRPRRSRRTRLGLKPQASEYSPFQGESALGPHPFVSTSKLLCLFVFILLIPVLAHASPPTREQKTAIAKLPAPYQAFLAEVEILLTDQERAAFLALAKDYQRDAFIQQFWGVRDDVKRTARNEFRERWEANLQQAKLLYGDLRDGRSRALLLNGPPAERVESGCSLILYPLEVWFYEPSKKLKEPFVLVLYRKWGTGPFKLWYPTEEGPEVLFAQSITSPALGEGHSLAEIASPGSNGCGDDEHARKILAGISWVLANARDWIYIQPLIDEPPRPPGGEWVSAFNSYSTDVPAGTPPLTAKLDLVFPGRWQNRTVMQGVVTVPPGAAGQARLGEARSYDLLLNGELLSNGELFDSFRYKFDLPAAPGESPESRPLAFERPLRPGDYTLILKLEDLSSGKVYREERPLAVPAMDILAPLPSIARTPEELESARILAEANAALRSGETTVKLIPPAGELQSGMRRFDTLTTGPGIDKVTFSLDGKPVLTKKAPPFSVELDLGTSPRTRTLAVAAFDSKGDTLASDEIQVNATDNRFRVHLVEPQQGKRYESSLLARAEVQAPEDETVERVELYLNETRIATLYQPPYIHPVVLPKGESLAYVRAVAYLTDGSSTEHLVFVNAPAEMAQVTVDYVELYASVLDRKGRPVTADLGARDFGVSEDGVKQQIARCERVTDLPIHAAVAIDVSASMEPNLDPAKAAALQFLQRLVRPRDRAEVITFNDHPSLAVKFTRDVKTLAGGLAGLKAERGTALYDSLIFSFYTFNGLKGRRALLLLSDGKDEGSRFTFEETLDFARRAGVTVYAIGLGDEVDKRKLARIAEETGGRAFFPRQAGELAGIYAGIEEELRSQILITYQSATNRADPGFRVVDLKVNRSGMEVKTIRGYYP
jgi:Ca-activated chloride channel family protein